MNEENKIGYYAVIPSSVLFNTELKANEKLLYAVITALANKEGFCFASNSYLAKQFDSKPHTVSNWIAHLSKLNFVYIEIIKNEKNEIIQRRIYPNDTPYTIKMTHPCTLNITEVMLQKEQYNNINIKIDRFFNYIIKKESQNPENFNKDEEIEFLKLLEKMEFNYTEDIVKILKEENIEKLKIIIYALKELYQSSRRQLIWKAKREKVIYIYDNCKSKQDEYEGTIKQINNFFDYYYRSLIRDLEEF